MASGTDGDVPAVAADPKVSRKRGADGERQRKLPRTLDSVAILVMAGLGEFDEKDTASVEKRELVWDALQTTELNLAMGSVFTGPAQPETNSSEDIVPEAQSAETSKDLSACKTSKE